VCSTLGKRFTSGSLPLVAEPHSATPCMHIAINQPKLLRSLLSLRFLPSTPHSTCCPFALHIHCPNACPLDAVLTGDHAQLTGSPSVIRALIDRCFLAPLAEAIRRSLRDYRQHPGLHLVASHRPVWAVAAIPPRAHKTRRFNPCHAPSALSSVAVSAVSCPAVSCPALPATANHSEPQRSPRASGREQPRD